MILRRPFFGPPVSAPPRSKPHFLSPSPPVLGLQLRVQATLNSAAEIRMKIFFSVGEPSGDLHGANLIRELKSRGASPDSADWEFVGYGGPRMAAAGAKLHKDLTQLAIMWFLRVLLNLHKFIGLARPSGTVLCRASSPTRWC